VLLLHIACYRDLLETEHSVHGEETCWKLNILYFCSRCRQTLKIRSGWPFSVKMHFGAF